MLVHRGPAVALVLVLAPLLVLALTRSYGGVALGLVLILTVPYWTTLGSAQIDVLRAASVAAATSLFWARGLRPTLVDWALAAFVLVSVLAWLLEFQQPGAGRVLSTELTPIGFYLGARSIPGRRLGLVLMVAVVAGAVGGLTVIYEFVRGHVVFANPLSYDWVAAPGSIFRPGGIFGSPPAASTVLCFIVLFGLGCVAIQRGRLRLLALGCTAVASLALLLTFTRAAFVAVALGVILMLWLLRSPLLRPLRLAWFVALFATAYFVLIPGLEGSATFQEGIVRPGTLTTRETYWATALPVSTESPRMFLFGVGTGALEAPRTSTGVAIAANVAERPQLTENSLHSQYITTLLEQGSVGLATVFLLLGAGVLPAGRRARAEGDPLAAAVAATIVAMGTVMTVDTAFLDSAGFALFMLALGLAAQMTPRSQPERT